MTSLASLPDELLLSILSEHTPLLDLAACALVCRRWRRLLDCRSFRHYHNARYSYLLSAFQVLSADVLRYVDLDLADKRGRRPLHAAVMSGDADLVEVLLDRIHAEVRPESRLTEYIDRPDTNGYTPLLLAVAKKNQGMVRRLADLGADVNVRNARDRTPIHLAVEGEDARLVKLLLSYRVRLDVFDFYGMSPLHLAAGASSFGMPRQTPDHAAAIEIVQALLDSGADPLLRDFFLQTPLHAAALAGADAFELVMRRALSWLSHDKGSAHLTPDAAGSRPVGREPCDVDSASNGAAAPAAGRPPPPPPAFPPSPSPASCGRDRPREEAPPAGGDDDDDARVLHDHPASWLDRGGYSPLHRAAEAGHLPVVAAAVRQTSEHSAALPRNVRPLDIDVRTAGRVTALQMAARKGHWDCANALVSAGADVDARNVNGGRTPLDLAEESDDCPRAMAAAWGKKRAGAKPQ